VNYAERYLCPLVAVVAPWEECIETVDDTGCVGVFVECRVLSTTVFFEVDQGLLVWSAIMMSLQGLTQ
jgi:hypothetical protein